jgi:hypothetical protein
MISIDIDKNNYYYCNLVEILNEVTIFKNTEINSFFVVNNNDFSNPIKGIFNDVYVVSRQEKFILLPKNKYKPIKEEEIFKCLL